MAVSELVEEALDNPSKRILKVLSAAEEQGWTTGVVSVCVRLSRGDVVAAARKATKADLRCKACHETTPVDGRTICPACRSLGRTAVAEEAPAEEALPFYATWIMKGWTEKGSPSWSFMGSRASNGQALSEADILVYLANPDVIHPDFAEEYA